MAAGDARDFVGGFEELEADHALAAFVFFWSCDAGVSEETIFVRDPLPSSPAAELLSNMML